MHLDRGEAESQCIRESPGEARREMTLWHFSGMLIFYCVVGICALVGDKVQRSREAKGQGSVIPVAGKTSVVPESIDETAILKDTDLEEELKKAFKKFDTNGD